MVRPASTAGLTTTRIGVPQTAADSAVTRLVEDPEDVEPAEEDPDDEEHHS